MKTEALAVDKLPHKSAVMTGCKHETESRNGRPPFLGATYLGEQHAIASGVREREQGSKEGVAQAGVRPQQRRQKAQPNHLQKGRKGGEGEEEKNGNVNGRLFG